MTQEQARQIINTNNLSELKQEIEFCFHSSLLHLIYFWQQANPDLTLSLWSPLVGKVWVLPLTLSDSCIKCIDAGNYKRVDFTPQGKFLDSSTCAAEVILFPSKEERNWDRFCIYNTKEINLPLSNEACHSFFQVWNRRENKRGNLDCWHHHSIDSLPVHSYHIIWENEFDGEWVEPGQQMKDLLFY